MKENNIFIELLKSLQVKYTLSNALKLYREHPHRYNLYGLSAMLTSYGIENVGIRMEDREEIREIETPFIAHAYNDFVLVKKIKDEKINYLWRDKWITLPLEKFMKSWSGVLLIAESDDKSIEPDYFANRKKEFWDSILSKLLWLFLFIGSLSVFAVSGLWMSLSGCLLVGLLLSGMYVCFLLLQKQMKVQSNYADKLCTLFKKSDCNNVLESDAAKFLGLFSWGEIGFGYFISTLLVSMFFPQWVSYCAWIGALTLPYTFWSVWYQCFKIKQWCPLCLTVMGLFWLIFIIYLFSGSLHRLSIEPVVLLWIGLLYVLPFLIIHRSVPILIEALSKQQLVYEMNNIKLNEDVFIVLLEKNRNYEVSLSTSQIIFGNIRAKTLISVFTNPHCEPCAIKHQQLEDLLRKTGDKYCVQYIFSSFEESLDISSKMLIAAYFRDGTEKVTELYDNWFKRGKYNKEVFFRQNNLSINGVVEEEFAKHEVWKRQNNLQATPTVLINGYELPEQYKIEDLELLEITER